MIASLSRQVFFQLPLILLFPLIWGLNGVLYAGPVADVCAVLLCSLLVRKTLARFNDKIGSEKLAEFENDAESSR